MPALFELRDVVEAVIVVANYFLLSLKIPRFYPDFGSIMKNKNRKPGKRSFLAT